MNEKSFLFKKKLYQHTFGLCNRFHIPYTYLKIYYYDFIMKQLLPTLELAFYKTKSIKISHSSAANEEERNVWVMWWQGIDNAPQIVKSNIRVMKRIFGSRLKVISQNNVFNYVEIDPLLRLKLKNGLIPPAQWSDIIRVALLKKYGGLWIDSTVVVSENILKLPGLFERSFVSICSNSNRTYNVSREDWTTWFIGGSSQNSLFTFLYNFFIEYFNSFNIILDYFLLDYAIRYFYNKDINLQIEINAQKRDWKPLYFYDNLYNTSKNVDLSIVNNVNYCVQKVTYKVDKKRIRSDSLYSYISNLD